MSDKELFKKLTALHLTQEEKRFMKQNVLLHAREHGILSPLTSMFIWSRSFVTVTAMAFVLLIGTTVVHGAEKSLPGDTLYTVKRGVNERVLGVFAVSPDAKARLETKFVDRRLEEIQQVIAREDDADLVVIAENQTSPEPLTMSPETLAIVVALTEEVQEHAAAAQEHISEVSNSGSADQALELASVLESSIDVHTTTLTALTQTDIGTEDTTLAALTETVQTLEATSSDISDLGDVIAVTITEDTSLVDLVKAEEQLDKAEGLVTEYRGMLALLDPVSSTPVETVETVAEETQPSVPAELLVETDTSAIESTTEDTKDIFSTVAALAPLPETVVDVSKEETIALPEETTAEETISDPLISAIAVETLPTLEDIDAEIVACKAFIAAANYAQAYISCTDAVQYISTLIRLHEKQVEAQASVSLSDTVSETPSEETTVEVVSVDAAGKVEPASIDASTLTGKVLNAFDTIEQ